MSVHERRVNEQAKGLMMVSMPGPSGGRYARELALSLEGELKLEKS